METTFNIQGGGGGTKARVFFPLHAPVWKVLDFVDAHKPVLRGKCFLQHLQLEVLVANLRLTHTVIPRRLVCCCRGRSKDANEAVNDRQAERVKG